MRAVPADRGRVQVSMDIDLRTADETGMHIAALQQAHEVDRARTPDGARDVGVVAHGVEELLRRFVAHYAELEETDRVRRVSSLGNHEGDKREAHPDEHPLTVADLARRLRDHDLAGRDVAQKRASAAGLPLSRSASQRGPSLRR